MDDGAPSVMTALDGRKPTPSADNSVSSRFYLSCWSAKIRYKTLIM